MAFTVAMQKLRRRSAMPASTLTARVKMPDLNLVKEEENKFKSIKNIKANRE